MPGEKLPTVLSILLEQFLQFPERGCSWQTQLQGHSCIDNNIVAEIKWMIWLGWVTPV